jgi:hypothetical protein
MTVRRTISKFPSGIRLNRMRKIIGRIYLSSNANFMKYHTPGSLIVGGRFMNDLT